MAIYFGTVAADSFMGGSAPDAIDGAPSADPSLDTGADTLRGGLGNDTIYGRAGADLLSGGGGWDELSGGDGNDVLLDNANGGSLSGGAGDDIITAVNIGTLIYDYLYIHGDDGDDRITVTGSGIGGGGPAYLWGDNGNDTISGSAAGDGVYGGTGYDRLAGNEGNDSIFGDVGHDTLDGGAGADELSGGAGNDIYVVDNAGDSVVEVAGEGTDTVITTLAAYTLGANVERLTATGGGDFTGTGNGLANILRGGGGDDSLFGGDGDDRLHGGLGADSLVGGRDDDTYYVDHLDDVVVEAAGEGADTVVTTLAAYTLGAHVERLTFAGTGDFTGTGNGLANFLTGGDGDDSLFGGGGNDNLRGGAGADELTGGQGHDIFRFNRSQAQGDLVVDFAGNGAAQGDRLLFSGYGTVAEGASFTALSATTWRVTSADGLTQEVITFANAANIHAADWSFV